MCPSSDTLIMLSGAKSVRPSASWRFGRISQLWCISQLWHFTQLWRSVCWKHTLGTVWETWFDRILVVCVQSTLKPEISCIDLPLRVNKPELDSLEVTLLGGVPLSGEQEGKVLSDVGCKATGVGNTAKHVCGVTEGSH